MPPKDIYQPTKNESVELKPDPGTMPEFDTLDGSQSLNLNMSYLEELGFNEELVELVVRPPQGQATLPSVMVGCNGEVLHIPVGQKVAIRRKFLGSLLLSKAVELTTSVFDEGEQRINMLHKNISERFNVRIIKDTPKGFAWYENYQLY